MHSFSSWWAFITNRAKGTFFLCLPCIYCWAILLNSRNCHIVLHGAVPHCSPGHGDWDSHSPYHQHHNWISIFIRFPFAFRWCVRLGIFLRFSEVPVHVLCPLAPGPFFIDLKVPLEIRLVWLFLSLYLCVFSFPDAAIFIHISLYGVCFLVAF